MNYLYVENGKWYQLDTEQAKRIDEELFAGGVADTGGKTLYPQFPKIKKDDTVTARRVVATVVRHNEQETVRWYWRILNHDKKHTHCCRLDDDICGIRMVRYMSWNSESDRWELEEMINPATPEQIKVLENKNNWR